MSKTSIYSDFLVFNHCNQFKFEIAPLIDEFFFFFFFFNFTSQRMVSSLQAQILNASEEGLAGTFSKTDMGILKYDANLANIPREVVLTYVYL